MMARKTKTGSLKDATLGLGEELWETGRRTYLAGLGAVAVTEAEARGLFQRLVNEGERFEGDERNVIHTAGREVRKFGHTVDKKIQKTVAVGLKRVGVPSRDEILVLTRKVETLTRKVEQMGASR
jgi:polyhydroxyalkanoate synthesis regulator phasin